MPNSTKICVLLHNSTDRPTRDTGNKDPLYGAYEKGGRQGTREVRRGKKAARTDRLGQERRDGQGGRVRRRGTTDKEGDGRRAAEAVVDGDSESSDEDGRGTGDGERPARDVQRQGTMGRFGLQLIRFQAHVLQQQQRVVCAVPVGVCAVRGGCVAHGLRTLTQIAALGKTGVGWLAGWLLYFRFGTHHVSVHICIVCARTTRMSVHHALLSNAPPHHLKDGAEGQRARPRSVLN